MRETTSGDLIFGLAARVPGSVCSDAGDWHVRKGQHAVTVNETLDRGSGVFVLSRISADPSLTEWSRDGGDLTGTADQIMAQARSWLTAA